MGDIFKIKQQWSSASHPSDEPCWQIKKKQKLNKNYANLCRIGIYTSPPINKHDTKGTDFDYTETTNERLMQNGKQTVDTHSPKQVLQM